MGSSIDLKSLDLKNINFSAVKNFFVNFLVPLVSLILTLVLVLLVLKPAYENIPNFKADLASKQGLSVQLDRKIKDLKFLVDYEQVLSEKSLRVSETLISKPEIPELLAQVDQMVKESGMKMSKLNYSSIKEAPDSVKYSLVGVALGAGGSPTQLLSFLEIAEKASRLVLIEDFRYSIDKQEISSSVLNVNFELLAPYLFVTSEAVTDESVDIDISSPEFQKLSDKLESLNHYDILPAESVVSEGPENPEELEEPESFPPESPIFVDEPEISPTEPTGLEPEIEEPEMPPIEPAE